MLNSISRPQNNLTLTPTSIDIENIRCFATWGDLKHILNYNPTPMKAQFLPLLNDNLSQPQLNSTSTQFQINFDSISYQPHFNLNSTSTLTSTQYGCDIKATQSCLDKCFPILVWLWPQKQRFQSHWLDPKNIFKPLLY